MKESVNTCFRENGMKTIPSAMVRENRTPFEVVWKAIGGEETVQSWVSKTTCNYRAKVSVYKGCKNICPAEVFRIKQEKIIISMFSISF